VAKAIKLCTTKEVAMKSLMIAAGIIMLTLGGLSAKAAPGPDISHYMVIVATSTSSSTSGLQMTTLTFPSERACTAAAAVFGQSAPGANIVARCAPVK
jgi:hypothetical protein